jgi:hypothetical protein
MTPPILFGPFVGVMVDRYPRKWVLAAAHLWRVLLMIVWGGWMWRDGVTPTLSGGGVYLIIAGLALADTISLPTQLALTPSLVTLSKLVEANSCLTLTGHAMVATAFLLAAAITSLGFSLLLIGEVALFATACALAISLPTQAHRQAGAAYLCPPLHSEALGVRRDGVLRLSLARFARELRDGVSYLRRHDLVRSLLTLEILEYWPHGAWTSALMLAYATQVLLGDEQLYGLQSALFYGGQLIGGCVSLAAAFWLRRYAGWVIVINAMINAIASLIFAATANVWLATAIYLLFGPSTALRDILQDSLLQTYVANDKQGRIYATRQMGVSLSYLLATLFFAWLADRISVQAVFAFSCGLYSLTVLFALSQTRLRCSQMSEAPPVTVALAGD